jgi:kinesin family member 5
MGIEFTVRCSILEIYKETLYDLLLNNENKNQELKIKESTKRGIYVQGLTQFQINTKEQMQKLIKEGQTKRQTRATRLNEYSSRSHTIMTIEITERLNNGAEK